MSFTGKLADLVIEFTMKGVNAVNAALDQTKTKLEGMKAGIDAAGKVGAYAFATLNGSVAGWVTAGIQGTAIADQLHFHMQRLSQTIAGLFRPELQKLIETIQKVTEWFRNLTPEQRENIVQWVKAAAAASAVAMILPRVFAGIQVVIGGLQQLAGWLGVIDVETGGILPAIGFLVTALTALAVGTETGRGALKGLWESIKPLVDALMEVGKIVWEALKPIGEVLVTVFEGIIKVLVPVVQFVGKVIAGIAAAVKPIIEIISMVITAVVELVGELMDTLSPIGEAFGELFGSVGELAGSLLGLLVPVAKVVIDVLKTVISFLLKIAKVIIEVVMTPIRLLAAGLKAIADAINQITGRAEKATPKKGKGDDRGPLAAGPSGFSDLASIYNRIAEQSVKLGVGGKSPEERLADTADMQLAEQQETNRLLRQEKSPFVK